MNIFAAVKGRVSMPEVCGMLGITPNRAGFIPCPHHSERTPSCKIYADSFYCYSCGCGGDVIQLVADSKGVSQLEAAREIDSFFSLGLMSGNGKPVPHRDRKPRKVSLDWCNAVYRDAVLDVLADACRTAWQLVGDCESYRRIEWIHQALLETKNEEVNQFKKEFGKDVEKIVNKYRSQLG